MKNDVPQGDSLRHRVVGVVIGIVVVALAAKLYPLAVVVYSYIADRNVRWLPFILVMIGAALLSGTCLGVYHIHTARKAKEAATNVG